MDSTPTSSPPPSPGPNLTLQATTSLELALDILLSNSQPITIRNALAAYIQAADFSPDAASCGGPEDAVTVEDAIIAFEHALDKHPLPLYASLIAPYVHPPLKKKSTKPKKKVKVKKSSPTYATGYPGGSSQAEPVSYRRPYIDEIDKLRRDYYTEKVENAIKMGSYPCTCGKCGDPSADLGGYLYDAFQRQTGGKYGQCYGYEVAIEYGIDPRFDVKAAMESGMLGTCGVEGCCCQYYSPGQDMHSQPIPKKTKRAKPKTKKRLRTVSNTTDRSSPGSSPDPFGPSTSAVTL